MRERDGPSPLSAAGDEIARLVAAKEAAEAASVAKSRYLASISHEIRSPLNAIYGYAQLMERGGDAVDVGEAARVIRRSAEHLTHLVEGLLDISLIENGVMRIHQDSVRFGPFLDQIAGMFRHSAAAKGLRFDYERPERLPDHVRMDEKRLRQVLVNLLSNAVKFTSSGAVGLRVRWSGQMAVFEISDTGPGIAQEDRARIFMPFERGAGPDARRQPGAGLGLAIADALVRILGGDLLLESVPGEGTMFRLCMMLGQVTGTAPAKAGEGVILGYEGPTRSILLVDDDADQLRPLCAHLESLGFAVTVAADGEAALSLCDAADGFDLILLDVHLPGLTGWETARRLRARYGAAVKLVMHSAHAQERGGSGDAEPVHDRFLLKPLGFDATVRAVGELLALHWRRSIAAQEPASAEPSVAEREPLPPAALSHVEKLRELLRIGHIRGIEGEIKALAETLPQSRDFIPRVYACLDRFDLPALRATLDEFA